MAQDLFAGLPLDYAFLDDGSSPAAAAAPATLSSKENVAPNAGGGDASHLLFEHDLSLGFAFPAYRPAPQHRHKRRRSDSDVLFGFQHALLSANGGNGTGGLDPVAEVATMPSMTMDVTMGLPMQMTAPRADLAALQEPVAMAPIGPVQVTTPVGLHASAPVATASDVGATTTTSPIPFQTQTSDESFKDMDEFLQDLSWAEIPTDMAQPMDVTSTSTTGHHPLVDQEQRAIEASPVAYRSQRIQEGVQELKMKRKRPQHARHHSNPVDLLHNLDQFRLLAQQTKQQQQLQHLQQQDPSSVLNPFAVPQSSGVVPFHPQQQQQQPPLQQQQQQQSPPHPQQFSQFQVPPQIASGSARSLHSRRSSLPNATGLATGGSTTVPPRAAARRAQRSSGLSMDLSQMNLGFLSVPEEDFQQQQHHFQQEFSQAVQQAGAPSKKPTATAASATDATSAAAAAAEEANRKLYKCGRCGQPKVGHICTMPDQRNNWTQVDLDVTKGIKVMRVNCHIMPVKSRWVTLDEENLQDEQLQRRHVSMISA